MRTATQWLEDYGDSHRNGTNKALHWICVPVIAWCVLGFLWLLPFPAGIRALHPVANWAGFAVLAALGYYALLSPRLALGAAPLLLALLWSIDLVVQWGALPLWSVCCSCSWQRGSDSSSVTPSRVSARPSSRMCSS